jgi:hypothetical protein
MRLIRSFSAFFTPPVHRTLASAGSSATPAGRRLGALCCWGEATSARKGQNLFRAKSKNIYTCSQESVSIEKNSAHMKKILYTLGLVCMIAVIIHQRKTSGGRR